MSFVDRALAHRLEAAYGRRGAAYAQAQGALHPGWGSAVEPLAGGLLVYAGRGAPVNRACALGFERPVERGDLAAVNRFYISRGEDPRADLCPLADPSLPRELRQTGFRLESFYSVLFQPLEVAPAPPAPAGIRIRPVAPEERALWQQIVAQGFSGQEPPPAPALQVIAPTLHSPETRLFLAWVDGQPAGGGALFIHAGAAELCSASTRPAFRRLGVHAALLHARLMEARQAGCDLAMLVTSPGSAAQHSAERSGFRLAYTKAVMLRARQRRPDIQFG